MVESVNGSCTTDVMCPATVDTNGDGDPTKSHLLDGKTPNINLSDPNWASQLVTVKKNEGIDIDSVDHVVLTFSFNTPQLFLLIEIDMFLCLSWNTGAAAVFVFGDNQTDFSISQGDYIGQFQLDDCLLACDSLTTVSLVMEIESNSYRIWHILLENDELHISPEWVHIAEVRFMTTSGERQLCTHPNGEPHNYIQKLNLK